MVVGGRTGSRAMESKRGRWGSCCKRSSQQGAQPRLCVQIQTHSGLTWRAAARELRRWGRDEGNSRGAGQSSSTFPRPYHGHVPTSPLVAGVSTVIEKDSNSTDRLERAQTNRWITRYLRSTVMPSVIYLYPRARPLRQTSKGLTYGIAMSTSNAGGRERQLSSRPPFESR